MHATAAGVSRGTWPALTRALLACEKTSFEKVQLNLSERKRRSCPVECIIKKDPFSSKVQGLEARDPSCELNIVPDREREYIPCTKSNSVEYDSFVS